MMIDQGPTHVTPYGDRLRWIIGGEETEGRYSLHHRTAPPGAAALPHSHEAVIEAFYVLDGELEFELAGQRLVGRAGSYVHVPRGVSHGWRAVGEKEAEALVMFSPAVPLAFFEEIDEATSAPGGPDRQRLVEITRKYNLA
jgi:quercetin dioxygenase-like cupin family protein